MLRCIQGGRQLFRTTYSRSSINYATSRFFSSQHKQVNEEDPVGQQVPKQPENGGTSAAEMENLLKRLEEKEAQLMDLNDKTLRVLAEMENVRMIARRDVDNAKKYAVFPFARDLLSVADNLGLALKSVPEAALSAEDGQSHLKGLYTGLGATESELLKVFEQHGIERFGEVGDKFDPNKYQAMFEVPSPEHEPGTVIDITKLGYSMGDRILRPAEVGVSRAA